ncbi:MAG: hypothetical protein ACP5LR_02940 [Athalassotoga sp.]|uniref:F0F1 ATP synthase subunit B family protein n=1 Tax=Athalassotoga sp. TaxID=2022597 RepID=UPI003D08815B
MSGIFLNFNGTSILQLMSFFILMYFMVKLLYKPFLSMIDKRKESVKAEYEKATSERIEAENLRRNAQKEFDEIKQKISIYEEEAKERIREYELREKARIDNEIKEMMENARSQIEIEKEKARQIIEKSAVTIAIALASKIIQQEIDEKSKKEFLMKQLSKIGDDK